MPQGAMEGSSGQTKSHLSIRASTTIYFLPKPSHFHACIDSMISCTTGGYLNLQMKTVEKMTKLVIRG